MNIWARQESTAMYLWQMRLDTQAAALREVICQSSTLTLQMADS